MRALIQRVLEASVSVGDEVVGRIGPGMLVLLGVAETDTSAEIELLASKTLGLRIFDDADGKMNLSLQEVGGAMLVVSQFTLLADCRKGRRPSYIAAAAPEKAKDYYERFAAHVATQGVVVATGRFRAMMRVSLVNDGPVTIWLDTDGLQARM